jgi:hypothetical protein
MVGGNYHQNYHKNRRRQVRIAEQYMYFIIYLELCEQNGQFDGLYNRFNVTCLIKILNKELKNIYKYLYK